LARPITHSVEAGALPLVRAALDPEARGGEYLTGVAYPKA
jgi:hypothetical protein